MGVARENFDREDGRIYATVILGIELAPFCLLQNHHEVVARLFLFLRQDFNDDCLLSLPVEELDRAFRPDVVKARLRRHLLRAVFALAVASTAIEPQDVEGQALARFRTLNGHSVRREGQTSGSTEVGGQDHVCRRDPPDLPKDIFGLGAHPPDEYGELLVYGVGRNRRPMNHKLLHLLVAEHGQSARVHRGVREEKAGRSR
mmetsp:Transcript_54635/g.118130  ORF Transcript_54635/g.118130 Transcript_54635/m.118130 type:complete len:202 (+) Transcript_54635:1332-1937(+)